MKRTDEGGCDSGTRIGTTRTASEQIYTWGTWWLEHGGRKMGRSKREFWSVRVCGAQATRAWDAEWSLAEASSVLNRYRSTWKVGVRREESDLG